MKELRRKIIAWTVPPLFDTIHHRIKYAAADEKLYGEIRKIYGRIKWAIHQELMNETYTL